VALNDALRILTEFRDAPAERAPLAQLTAACEKKSTPANKAPSVFYGVDPATGRIDMEAVARIAAVVTLRTIRVPPSPTRRRRYAAMTGEGLDSGCRGLAMLENEHEGGAPCQER
jgi:hypothetical protein